MKGIEGIIFDCDGVMFESRQANLAYYNTILDHFGEGAVDPGDKRRAHLCHTAASPVVFEALLGPERLEEALEFARTIDYGRFIPSMVPQPGLTDALGQLAERMPLAVATNRGTSMQGILRHFNLAGFFRVVVTSRDVPRPKPYPDMLLTAARQVGVPVPRILFVGDSELDRAAAAAAGMPFAAYGGLVEGDFNIGTHSELVCLVD